MCLLNYNLLVSITLLFLLNSENINQEVGRAPKSADTITGNRTELKIIPAAECFGDYAAFIKNKRVALVVNQTAVVGNKHLTDFLLGNNINIVKIFAPEHGFRGNYDPGQKFDNQLDSATNLPIITLFGKLKRPTCDQLKDVDVVIFDIQDVGVRFFTFISTMHEVMEACAECNKEMIVLDRPNPNGDYVDGPVLKTPDFKSFVGMHPIPVVHGLTVGELALMIYGEKWLTNTDSFPLHVIPVKNYTHKSHYSLPIKPSPNLVNDLAIRLYPSLCFFEATDISVGRGTDFPFLILGYPDKKYGEFTFIPRDISGMQTNPMHEGKTCYGIDLRTDTLTTRFSLKYLIQFYTLSGNSAGFFSRPKWFNLLAGNAILIEQIKNKLSEDEIRKSWQPELNEYKKMRKKYLLYEDFE